MKNLILVAGAIGILGLATWWLTRETPYHWDLPPDLPLPLVPADNPMSAAKIELGRWLFYDKRLSGNNTMSLVNVAYASRLTWANPLLDRLEDQALTPLLGDTPVEMGLGGSEDRFPELLRSEANYSRLVIEAFPSDEDPHSLLNGVRAITAFVRTISSYDSPYDRYLAGPGCST